MENLTKIAAHVPGVVYQYQRWPDGRSAFPYASPGIRSIYGIEAEAVRQDASAVFAALHPDDLDAVSASIQKSEKDLSIWRATYRVCHQDGKVLWVEGEATPERQSDGSTIWHGYIRDVTDSKKLEQEVEESGARYRSVVQSSKDGFMLVDAAGTIRQVNLALCELLGYTADELVGLGVTALHYGETEQDVVSRVEAIKSQGGAQFEAEYQCKDGSLIPVEISIGYSDLTPAEFFAFVRDIRARRLDQELTRLRAELFREVMEGNEETLLRVAVDTAERITHSQSGFFHFFDKDNETISLSTWSTATMEGACGLKAVPSHYPLNKAGVWADAVRQQEPVIVDFEEDISKKAQLPFGHAPLFRGLFVPVVRDAHVVAILGVGNKFRKYDQQDISLVSQVAEVVFDYVERSFAEQRVRRMAFFDPLTDLPNRRLLTDRLERAIAQARRVNSKLAVCYLDIDNFKPVNDKWGHEFGDELLKAFTTRLKAEVREVDTLARIGGDEFVVVLTQVDGPHSIDGFLTRVLKVSSLPFRIGQRKIDLSVSIGITLFPSDDIDSDGLIRDADHAMYKAKSRGRNTYEFYDPEETRLLQQQREMIEELEFAIETGQLLLHFQPRTVLKTGEVAGFEVLIRWQHPERGLIFPDQFLPLIQGTHLEWQVDRFVLSSAIAVHKRWAKEGHKLSLSVNLTSSTLQMPDFPQRIKALFGDAIGEVAPYFEFEVLEQESIEDMDRVANVMLDCVGLGVKFSLDDFGTGFSSLSYFHKLPIEIVKIDQGFVRNMFVNPKDYGIVEGVLRLASAIDRPVVAEGVESIDLGVMLALSGCRYAQGYGIAKPMPEGSVLEWLEAWADPGNQWLALGDHLEAPSEQIDLNAALFSFKSWRSRVVNAEDRAGDVAQACGSFRPTAFEEWLGGVGAAHYGKLARWEHLRQVYELSCAEYDRFGMAPNEQESQQSWTRFLERSQEVEDLLAELRSNLASGARP
jgi:diguanylate cyclase (GGDEF)-like protein/PAS domain S-box-containing protein